MAPGERTRGEWHLAWGSSAAIPAADLQPGSSEKSQPGGEWVFTSQTLESFRPEKLLKMKREMRGKDENCDGLY